MKALAVLFVSFALLASVAPARSATPDRWPLPRSFVPQVLCVHSGWHWRPAVTAAERRRGEYAIAGSWWIRTVDVPDSVFGGSGEASWTNVNGSYGGGLQFMLGTWNRAADLSHGRLPHANSHAEIAALPARAQMYGALMIVRQDAGSWREWPNTARACGLL